MVRAKTLDVVAIRKQWQRTHVGAANRSAQLPGHSKEDLTDAEVEFGLAIQRYKTENRRPHPTYSEVLAVLVALGYRRPDLHDPPA